jgi:hypothetical protein
MNLILILPFILIGKTCPLGGNASVVHCTSYPPKHVPIFVKIVAVRICHDCVIYTFFFFFFLCMSAKEGNGDSN